jgi:uncharacterized membrane protein
MTTAIAYITALVLFLAIDLAWLMWLGRGLYVSEIGALLRPKPLLAAAVAFYLLYSAGLVLFAILPGLAVSSAFRAALLGAALGLVAYGTYDLTNLAVTQGFTLKIAVIDMLWGMMLSGAVAGLAAWAVMLTGRN